MNTARVEVDRPLIRLDGSTLAVSQIDHYRVYRASAVGGPYTYVQDQANGGLAHVTADVAGLAPGDYWFKVSAVDTNAQEGSQSPATGKLTVPATLPALPGPPTNAAVSLV